MKICRSLLLKRETARAATCPLNTAAIAIATCARGHQAFQPLPAEPAHTTGRRSPRQLVQKRAAVSVVECVHEGAASPVSVGSEHPHHEPDKIKRPAIPERHLHQHPHLRPQASDASISPVEQMSPSSLLNRTSPAEAAIDIPRNANVIACCMQRASAKTGLRKKTQAEAARSLRTSTWLPSSFLPRITAFWYRIFLQAPRIRHPTKTASGTAAAACAR